MTGGRAHEQPVQAMESHTQQKTWARSVLAEVEKGKQNGTDGDWQHVTRVKKEPEFLRHTSGLSFEGTLMRRAYNASGSVRER